MKNYDKNGDGKLDKKEIKEMRRPPKDADKNRDGYVDLTELIASYEKGSGVKKKDDKSESKTNSRAEKLRRTAKNKNFNQDDSIFGGKDVNSDRQLQMAEFSDEWNDDVVAEFREKDTNGDGVITEAEWKG